MLKGKSILLGITGSVAAYKAIDLIKMLKADGASVRVIMTEASKRFITPVSIELAAGERVFTDMYEPLLSHINLPKEADLFLVAPATADIIGKFAGGLADDLLSTALLAAGPEIMFAPAMNSRMYNSPAVKRNLEMLASAGVKIVGPEIGQLACGMEGIGRMSEAEKIVDSVVDLFTKKDLRGESVLVTAGPTREHIDPVRYISNRSSGKMGYAIARAARMRGAEVLLISGPVHIKPPEGVELISVETADEMLCAVMDNLSMSTIFVMSAAVSDFTPSETSGVKLEKKERLGVELIKTADIIEKVARLKKRPFVAGFAAETGSNTDRAARKLKSKGLDMIVFNDVSSPGSGFDTDTNEIVIIDAQGQIKHPLMSKDEVANIIFDHIMERKS